MQWRRTARSVLLAACAGLAVAAPVGGLVGDCDDDGVVRISELVTGVAIALGSLPVERCAAIDANVDGAVRINELVLAVAAALAPPVATPTPRFVIIDLGVAGGQTCGVTQATFTIPDDPLVSINALRIEFCVDENAFDVEAVTCLSFDPTVVFDAVETRRECRLGSPSAPVGQVSVRAHGAGGSGDAFAPGDAIQCSIPVLATTGEGDYAIRFLVVADTSAGAVANAGQGTIHVFGLPDTDRFQGQCCTADSQCQSGVCRGGDATQIPVCCENDCAGGICNNAGFAGSCCAASGLPEVCNQP
jgi:hypothetical protein